MRLTAYLRHQPRPPSRAALIGQHRKIGIGAILDPLLDHLATGALEGSQLQLAMLERNHPPAAGLENIVKPAKHPIRRGAVERLAVVIDHPPAIAQIVLIALNQAFIDIALIQLGIAHQRDHPPGLFRR